MKGILAGHRAIFFILICFGALGAFGQRKAILSSREIAKIALPSSVFIAVTNPELKSASIGSGFFVAPDVVVTNHHVINDGISGFIQAHNSNETYQIEGIVGIDRVNDLALIKVSNLRGVAATLSVGKPVQIGEPVFAVGSPKGLQSTFSSGIVSSVRDDGGRKLIQITTPISPGSSGGPILNEYGEVVGVAVGGIEGGQSLNFAIPVAFVSALIKNRSQLISLKQNYYEPSIGTARKSQLGIEMIYLGSVDEVDRPSKRNVWLGKFEVTQDQWIKVMSRNPSKYSSCGGKCPVENISYRDVLDFLNRINKLSNDFVYRLPTTAEWTFATKGGKATQFYWGDLENQVCKFENVYDISGVKDPSSLLRTHVGCDDGYPLTAPVGSFSANPYGFHDLMGNVGEMFSDLRQVAPPYFPGEEPFQRAAFLGSFANYIFYSTAVHPIGERMVSSNIGFRIAAEYKVTAD